MLVPSLNRSILFPGNLLDAENVSTTKVRRI